MSVLSTSLGRLALSSPVLVASGTFGKEYFDLFPQEVLGAYVSKTITSEPRAGNPPPRLYETEAGLLNAIGLQNPGLEVFVGTELPLLAEQLRIPLLVSFSGSTESEFCRILSRLESLPGIAGYEVNVSCPNVEKEGIAFGVDPDVVYSLTRKLAALTSRELCVKLSPNVTDITAVAKAAEAGGASSLALINTLYGMAIDWQTGRSRISRPVCGYSGPGIKPVALALTYKTAQAVRIPLLAMGGISTWQDALEFFYAGASAVAVGTASFHDPLAIPRLVEGLAEHLSQKGLPLSSLIGTAIC